LDTKKEIELFKVNASSNNDKNLKFDKQKNQFVSDILEF
jgi:hypothetical protein